MDSDKMEVLAARVSELEWRVAAVKNYDEPLDSVWLLLCGYLIWFMGAGFCFLEMGSVRVKHSENILAKNLLVPVLAFFCWYLTGYALAFGDGGHRAGKFIGGSFFAMHGFREQKENFRKWFFQGAFCDTCASIVSGGTAERMTMFGYAIHTVVLTCFIYPVGVHWAWSEVGWLKFTDPATGEFRSVVGPCYQDWAGSGVIHLVGGVAALSGALVVGPRVGRFIEGHHEQDFTPHSVPFTVLGTFILWLGWFGFNSGGNLAMHTDAMAYKAAIATCNSSLAPAAGALVAFLLRCYVVPPYHFDVTALCNGVLAGLVAVTASCGFIDMWEAAVIGVVAGVLYCLSCMALVELKVDDPIDAISVHMVNGLWGAIAAGLFGDPKPGNGGNGLLYGGNQLGVQALACTCFIAWSGTLSLIVFTSIQLAGQLRWSEEVQIRGANIMQHSLLEDYDTSGTA